MNALGYIRISPRGADYHGVSLEVQTKGIQNYCKFKEWNLIGVYGDKFISGKYMKDRPGLNAVLTLACDKRIDAVVVYKLDRFSRNTIELLDAVSVLEDRDVVFASVCEEVNTKSATGKFFLTMLGALGQMEREQVSERTKAALQLKKDRGEKIGGYIPYGFAMKNKKLVPDLKDYECYLRVKQLKQEGVPYTLWEDILFAEGFVSRWGKKRSYSNIWRLRRRFDENDIEDIWAQRLGDNAPTMEEIIIN